MASEELTPRENTPETIKAAKLSNAIAPYSVADKCAVKIGIKRMLMVWTRIVPRPYTAEPESSLLRGEVCMTTPLGAKSFVPCDISVTWAYALDA
jgi:hypothetical protein